MIFILIYMVFQFSDVNIHPFTVTNEIEFSLSDHSLEPNDDFQFFATYSQIILIILYIDINFRAFTTSFIGHFYFLTEIFYGSKYFIQNNPLS